MPFFQITLGEIPLVLESRFEKTIRYFEEYWPNHTETEITDTKSPISIPESDWKQFIADGMENSAHTEYSMFTEYCSDAIIPNNRVLIHGVAIRWQNQAYLICANSGVGKSTQARWLQELCPGKFEIICGDRPLLRFPDPDNPENDLNGKIMVCPSPWNGKENWHGAAAAPLAGIILLERGEKNQLFSLTEKEAALRFFPNIIQSYYDADIIKSVAKLETIILNNVPVWKLITNKVPDSTKLLLESIFVQSQ